MASQLDKIPANVVNLVREEERIRRLHTEALGRYNYLKQLIADKKVQAESSGASNPAAAAAAATYMDESIEVEEKNAELHILSTEASMIYYYFEHATNSWLFLERDRLNGSSTMFTIQRKGNNYAPNVQVLST
uniref:Uncharacterized protein n=1 Tax=Panagrolaimus sp. ES5 TaxID=591445 RepID=A0AC34GWH9_9BILA